MGFIAPSAGGEDHFVHRSFLQGAESLVVGSMVQFDASWDAAKNKAIARNVSACGAAPTASSYGAVAAPAFASPPGRTTGIVKAWAEERGGQG